MAASPVSPDPSKWRRLFTKREINTLREGRLPDARARVSRSRRLVSYNEDVPEHQGLTDDDAYRATTSKSDDEIPVRQARTPLFSGSRVAQLARAREVLEATDVLGSIPAACVICGRRLRSVTEGPRVTILFHDGPGPAERAVVYCARCFADLDVPLDRRNWIDGLSQLERQIMRLWAKGLKQKHIAARLTNQYQHISQPTVSRIIAKIRRKQRARKVN